jgi:hypothetical protein
MKKVRSHNGAAYVYQVHASHQDALENAIKGILSPVGDKVILSGCVTAATGGGNYSVSEGWVSWGGELYFMAAHSFFNPIPNPMILYKTVSQTNYPELSADGLSRVMVEQTDVKIKGAAAPLAGEVLWSDFSRYAKVLQDFTKNNQPAWRTVPANGTAEADKFLAPAVTGTISQLQYKLTYDNILCLRGHFRLGQVGVSEAVIFTLPVGYRPDRAFTCRALIADSMSQHFDSKIMIATDGTVTLDFAGINSSDFEYTIESMVCIPL